MTLLSFTIIGAVVALIGLAVTVFSFMFIKENRSSNIITGIFFSVIGFLIFWLSLNPDKSIGANLGLSDKSTSFLVLVLVLGAFIYKAITIFQEGTEELKGKNLSRSSLLRSRWKISSAILMLIFYAFILLMVFSWLWKT